MIKFSIRTASLLGLLMSGCDLLSPCRSQCELAAGPCDERPISEFKNYEQTLAEWTAALEGVACDSSFPFLVAGTCGDQGLRFLRWGGGFTSETRYFDPESLEFVALQTSTDVIDLVCFGRGFWPVQVVCEDATVTLEICGSGLATGQMFVLPSEFVWLPISLPE